MSDSVNIVAYEAGARLVAVEDREVRTFVVERTQDGASVLENVNTDEPTVLFKGSEEEAARVLRGLHASFVGSRVEQSNHRRVFASAVAVVIVTGILGVGLGVYVRGGSGIDLARVGAAPDRIVSNNPEEDAFTAAGNDDRSASVSPHGSTGSTVASSMARPGGVSPAGRPPKLPPIPVPPAASMAGDAATIRQVKADLAKADTAKSEPTKSDPAKPDPARSEPPKSGIAARAADVAVQSEDEVKAAKEAVARNGTEPAEKELAELKAALAGLGQQDKLTPEVVKTLPHDLAKQLTDAGVVETPDETLARVSGKGPKRFSIVHLPPTVADAYRDHDNVPTIPEENSWTASGGNVVLPLPGGGEIRKPSDLALFHLQG